MRRYLDIARWVVARIIAPPLHVATVTPSNQAGPMTLPIPLLLVRRGLDEWAVAMEAEAAALTDGPVEYLHLDIPVTSRFARDSR